MEEEYEGGMSITTVVIAVLAILVLVILFYVFITNIGGGGYYIDEYKDLCESKSLAYNDNRSIGNSKIEYECINYTTNKITKYTYTGVEE